MRRIPRRLLNKLVSVTKSDSVVSTSGDVGNSEIVVYNNVPMRIVSNDKYGDGSLDIPGYISASTHIGFSDPEYNGIKQGYYVKTLSNRYIVLHVDLEPGGVTDHHIEVFLRHSDVFDADIS